MIEGAPAEIQGQKLISKTIPMVKPMFPDHILCLQTGRQATFSSFIRTLAGQCINHTLAWQYVYVTLYTHPPANMPEKGMTKPPIIDQPRRKVNVFLLHYDNGRGERARRAARVWPQVLRQGRPCVRQRAGFICIVSTYIVIVIQFY